MNDNKFLYAELQEQGKNIYVSGEGMDLLLIYIENLKDNYYKVYLFKKYPMINLIDYKIIPLTESFKTIYKHIRQYKFKNYCFYEENIKNIAIELLNLYNYDDLMYKKTLKTAYQMSLCIVESLIVDYEVIGKQRTIINSISDRNILKILYVNEILK